MKVRTRIGRNKLLSVQNFATKRLMKDLAQIKREPLPSISALPKEDDLFEWHCNILGPKDTPWEVCFFNEDMLVYNCCKLMIFL